MMRVLFLIAIAIGLVAEAFPASAYTCTEWCHINRCNRGEQTGSVPVRVCIEPVRRVLSASPIQAEVERFLIEITICWMHGRLCIMTLG